MRRLLPTCSLVLLGGLGALCAPRALAQPWFDAAKVQTIAPSELRPGMKGEVWTVFQGSEPEPFEVEFVGTLENEIGPGKHMLLCRLTDPRVQLMGAVAGMSGSPLYINGRLVGALSYSIQIFETVKHAGFTPIADILEVSTFTGHGPDDSVRPAKPAAVAGGAASAPLSTGAGTRRLLRPVFTATGLSQATLDAFAEPLRAAGIELEAGGGGAAAGNAAVASVEVVAPKRDHGFLPGDPIAAALSYGDVTLAGTGTVSYVNGEEIYGFGHPMMGIGTVDMPMAQAEIVTIAASAYRSFKVSNTRAVVGSITQDRLSAIYGRYGRKAPTIPVTLTMHEAAGPRTLRSSVVIDRGLTPMIAAICLYQGLSSRNASDRFEGQELVWSVSFEGLPTIARQEILAGEGAEIGAAFRVLGTLRELMDNPLGRARPTAVEASIRPLSAHPGTTLTTFRLQPGPYRQGDTLRAEVMVRDHQGTPRAETLRFALPADLAPGSYELALLPGPALDQRQGGLAARAGDALSLAELANSLRAQRQGDGLYLALLESRGEVGDAGATVSRPPGSYSRVAGAYDPARFGPREGAHILLEQRVLPGRVFDSGTSVQLTVED